MGESSVREAETRIAGVGHCGLAGNVDLDDTGEKCAERKKKPPLVGPALRKEVACFSKAVGSCVNDAKRAEKREEGVEVLWRELIGALVGSDEVPIETPDRKENQEICVDQCLTHGLVAILDGLDLASLGVDAYELVVTVGALVGVA